MSAKFGPGGNSDAFKQAGYSATQKAPEWLSKIGLDAYEYEAGNGLVAGPATLGLIGREAAKYNIKMSYHAPYFISLSGIVEEKRLKSIEYIRQSIEAARLLGAGTIVVHCGSCAKISREEAMKLSADTLARTVNEVETYGIKIGIETMGKVNQLGTLDEVLSLCTISPSLVPVIDFGHLNARDLGGVFNTCDDYLRVFDRIDTNLGSLVLDSLHCHFSKIEWTGSGEKRHLTFADDVYGPDYEPFVEAIAKAGISPTVICESAGTQSDDALAMKTKYLEYLR